MSKETNSANGKMSKLALIMYIAAGVLGAIFIYMFIYAINYINNYITSYSMSFGDMWKDAIQYIVSSSINYLVFALLLFIGGKTLDTVNKKCGDCAPAKTQAVKSAEAATAERPAAIEVAGIKVPPIFR